MDVKRRTDDAWEERVNRVDGCRRVDSKLWDGRAEKAGLHGRRMGRGSSDGRTLYNVCKPIDV